MLSSQLSAVVLGYYPSWETGIKPADLNFKRFTHLCHAFVTSDIQGNLKFDGNLPSAELVSQAHAKGVKVMLSLGGADSGKIFNVMTKDTKANSRYVAAVIKLMRDNGYDGLDVDWEFPESDADKDRLSALMKQFRVKLPDAILSMAVPASDWNGKWFDAQTLLPLVDFINVMAYDFHGPWSDVAGPNAALYRAKADPNSAVTAVDYWTKQKGWPKSKLILGIPCYGRGFATNKWYQPVTAKYPGDEIAFKSIANYLKQGWARHWDVEAGVPYLSDAKHQVLISYEDEKSAKLKGDWARKQNLRGIFFWEITSDMVDHDHVLVKAASQGFSDK